MVDVPAPGLRVVVRQRLGDVIEVHGGDEPGGHPVLHERDQVVPYGKQLLPTEPIAREEGADPAAQQRLGAEDVAHPRDDRLVHEQFPHGLPAPLRTGNELIRVGVGAQRIRAQTPVHGGHLLGVEKLAGSRAGEIGDAVLPQQAQAHRTARLRGAPLPRRGRAVGVPVGVIGAVRAAQTRERGAAPVAQRVLPAITDPSARGADGVRCREGGVAVEGPRAVQPQVDAQPNHRLGFQRHVGLRSEGQEEVLAVRLGPQEDLVVEPGRTVGEAALRRARPQAPPDIELAQCGGESMNGVALGHSADSLRTYADLPGFTGNCRETTRTAAGRPAPDRSAQHCSTLLAC